MKPIKTLETKNLCESAKKGGCGECQTSCQSACKTSCGIANQQEEQQITAESAAVIGRHFYIVHISRFRGISL